MRPEKMVDLIHWARAFNHNSIVVLSGGPRIKALDSL